MSCTFLKRWLNLTTVLSLVLGLVSGAFAQETEAQVIHARTVLPFLKQHCYECHDAAKAKAGLRLDQLGTDFLAGKTADIWHEVINSINAGEMPPEKVTKRPDAAQSFAVVEWVGRELKNAEKTARMSGGRIMSRRLNRDEYLNTVRDLLFVDDNFVATLRDSLPGDGKAEGFDRLGAALLFDGTQLDTYIKLGERLAEHAIVANELATTNEASKKITIETAKSWRPSKGKDEVIQYQKDTAIPIGPDWSENTGHGVVFLQPQGGDKAEFGGLGSLFNFAFNNLPVTKDGYYRIRLKAGAFQGQHTEPVKMQLTYLANTPLQLQESFVVKGSLDKPEINELVVFLRQPPEGSSAKLGFGWNGYRDLIIMHPDLSPITGKRLRATGAVQKLISAKAPKEEIDAAKAEVENTIQAARAFAQRPDAVMRIFNPKYDLAKVPRLLVEWVEFEGPIEKEWPPASHVALFPKGISTESTALHAMFSKFLSRAYRRPATDEDIKRAIAIVLAGKKNFAMSDVDALRYGLQTVLSSPEFLLLFEPSVPGAAKRNITDFELANRLSYFLWSSMPDETLFQLAQSGKLHQPDVLKQQVLRMIASPKARELAENFAGQWLHVRDYESVMPANDYKDYDESLRLAEAEEPLAFFEEVMRNNLSLLNFIQSDFTMCNERLAKFYGIPNVEGSHFRRVALNSEHQRGGVLTMAGLLTYLADGTRTLPVRRGAFILEEIFNSPPPPPPPNAGEIQPNVKGQNLTVRQRLEQHRQEPTCASCHAKIDPLGLALENYDAIGAWRERQNGEGMRGTKAPLIDVTGTLPSGRSFKNPSEFKQALLAEKDRFIYAFTQKMLTYALGRPVGYIDNDTVKRITDVLAKNDYRLPELLLGVVTSEPFLTK